MRPDASEVLVLQSDPSAGREYLGWSPSVTLEDGVERTAAWLQQHQHAYHADFFYV